MGLLNRTRKNHQSADTRKCYLMMAEVDTDGNIKTKVVDNKPLELVQPIGPFNIKMADLYQDGIEADDIKADVAEVFDVLGKLSSTGHRKYIGYTVHQNGDHPWKAYGYHKEYNPDGFMFVDGRPDDSSKEDEVTDQMPRTRSGLRASNGR